MSNELTTVQQELRIAKQESEIMDLKFQLQKVQAEKSSRLENSLFSAALFPHYQKVAETLAKSDMVPKDYRGKPDNVLVAMEMGYQLGLPVAQCLQDIAVINGRPALWGDGLLALALSHPDCRGIQEEPIYDKGVVVGYTCTVNRKNHEPHTKSFTIQQAKQAGLLGKPGPWTQYPERMLQMRARVAIKDKFADALRGFKVVEIDEYDDSRLIQGEIVNSEKSMTQTEKLKNMLNYKPFIIDAETGVIENNSEIMPKEEPVVEDDNIPISPENMDKIEILMEEKAFDEERKKRAYDYFKVEKLSDLTQAQAKIFLLQLGKT